MRRFQLHREVDATGVSGVGLVAEGVVFSTGWVALTWLTGITSLVFYPSIENVEAIHGHGGLTKIFWEDLEPQVLESIGTTGLPLQEEIDRLFEQFKPGNLPVLIPIPNRRLYETGIRKEELEKQIAQHPLVARVQIHSEAILTDSGGRITHNLVQEDKLLVRIEFKEPGSELYRDVEAEIHRCRPGSLPIIIPIPQRLLDKYELTLEDMARRARTYPQVESVKTLDESVYMNKAGQIVPSPSEKTVALRIEFKESVK